MTNSTDRFALTDAVQSLTSALFQAQEDIALLDRLTKAKAEAKRLEAELAVAQDALAKAMADEVQARRVNSYAGFRDISIRESGDESVLWRSYEISITRDRFNGFENAPVTETFMGFDGMPAEAWTYLFDVRPDQIPASILALSPEGDPMDAFNTYFTGKKRGYLIGPAAA